MLIKIIRMFSIKKLNNAEINNHNRMKNINIYKFKISKQTYKLFM